MQHYLAHIRHRWALVFRPSAERIPCPEPFNEIDVPPTLVSFAVDVAKEQDIVTPELKTAGDKLMYFTIDHDAYDLPDYAQVMKLYDAVYSLIQDQKAESGICTGCKRSGSCSQQDGIW